MTHKILKETIREYYKYQSWTQPTLSSDTSYGTITSSITTWNDGQVWHISDGVKGTSNKWGGASGSGNVIWHLPEKIKINSFQVYQTNETSYLNRFPKTIKLYASDNGIDYTEVGSASDYSQPASAGYVNVTCNTSKVYEYYKWEFGTSWKGSEVAVSEIVITAQKATTGTSSDYDFYEDITTYKMLTENVRKYYKYTNIPNCEAVGSPSVSNGVISSFTTSNYYQINDMAKNYDFIIKLKTPTDITSTCTFFNSYHFLTIDMENGIISSYKSEDSTRQTIISCSANTWYWIKIRVSGHTKICSYSTNGTDYTQAIVFTDTSTTISDTPLRFGLGVDSDYSNTSKSWITEQICRGQIDLKECYIKDYASDKIVWRGMQYTESTSSNYDFYEDINVYKALKQ